MAQKMIEKNEEMIEYWNDRTVSSRYTRMMIHIIIRSSIFGKRKRKSSNKLYETMDGH